MRTLSVFEYGQVEPLTRTEKNLLDQLRGPCDERLFEAGWRETRATSFVGGAPGGRALPARLAVLKGRWLVAAQAGRPDGWRRDRFDVAYDEFTEDNLPNRLFKATVHRLSRWSQWTNTRLRGRSHFGAAKARRHLTQFRAEEAATDSHGCSPIESVSHLCLSVANVPLPGRTETFAFLFTMNQLFEEFIAEFIRRELREVWQSWGWTLFHAQSGTLQGAKPASDRGDLVIVSQVGGVFN